MVLGLRPISFLGAFVILFLSFHRCRALDSSASETHSRTNASGPNQMIKCETLNISLPLGTVNPPQGDISYHILALEPGGKATMSLVGYEPSSPHWTTQYPTGTQIFVALLDSFGTILGVLPATYTIAPGSTECLIEPEPSSALETTQLKISTSVFGRFIPCASWEMSFSGGKPPYSVSIVALESGNIYHYSVPSGGHIQSRMNSRELSGQVVVLVRDANGMFGTTSSIANTQDTSSADPSDGLSRCQPAQPRDLPFRPREPLRATAFRFRRTLPDYPHMQFSRDLDTANVSHADTIIVGICVALGGIGIVAMVIYAVKRYFRRRKLLDAQDTLPRPFEVTIPAATTRGTSLITRDLTSPHTLGISRRIYSQKGGRCTGEAPRRELSVNVKPSRAGSALTRTTTTPSQSQPALSHNTRLQPHISDASLPSNHAGPSSYRTPLHSWTRPDISTPSDPQPQPHSRVQPRQSSSPLPTRTQSQRTAGVSVSRSASTREQHSAKPALWLSRSASELYSATSSRPRYRMPEYGSHGPHTLSGGYAHRNGEGELHVDMLSRPTNHLRHWHSASPVAHVQHVREEEEEDIGTAIIFQHQDAGVMQELPPPYHKLVRSSADV